MKQVLLRRGKIFVEDVPAPLVGKGNILVEVGYSLISTGTEVEGIRRSGEPLVRKAAEHPERFKELIGILTERGVKKTLSFVGSKINAGQALGYSCSGIAIQVGEEVEGIKPGDRVACAGAGKANHAEIVLVPENLVVRVPDGCGLEDAASVALGSIAMQGVRRAGSSLGEIVAVIGLGLLGQITVQLLKSAGCRTIGFDILAERVELAEELGLDRGFTVPEEDAIGQVLHLTDAHGVDATIITAAAPGDNDIIRLAAEITRKKGKIVVVGDVGLGLRRSPLYEKEMDVLISSSYGPGRYDDNYETKGVDYPYAYVRWTEKRNMAEYLQLLAESKLDFRRLVWRTYPFEQAPEAYRALRDSDEKPLAILLDFHLDEAETNAKIKTRLEITPGVKAGNRPINVAVIGAGGFAKSVHLPNLQKLSDLYRIRAIGTATGVNAKEAAKQFGAVYCSTDYREILADDEVDMVIICTRHNLHSRISEEAARAGKAIYSEKPMALNQVELEELVNALSDTGVPFTVGFNRRFSPAARMSREIVRFRINPLTVIYSVNAGFIPPENWVHGEEGGGRIVGEACHMFDIFNYLTGSEIASFDVSAISPATENISARDNFAATLKYADGSVCTLIYTALGAPELPKERIEIYCDNRTLVIDDFKELSVYGGKGGGWKGPQDKGHMKALESFGRSICNREGPIIPLEELVRATEISFLVDREVSR